MHKQSFQKLEFFQMMVLGIGAWMMVFMTACGVSVVDANPDSNKSAAPAAQSSAAYEIVATSEPNRYEIQFRSDLQARLNSSEAVESEGAVTMSTGEYCGGCVYQFSFQNGSKMRVRFPKDIVLSDVMNVDSQVQEWKISTDGRIFLKRSLILINEDKPLFLEANEIVSENAQIENFDKNTEAKMGVPGRNGGTITLSAKKISGSLTVSLRGEKGGGGIPGVPFERAYPGLSYAKTRGISCENFKLGGAGGDGKNGRAGGRGLSGGKSGDFVLNVADRTAFEIHVENQPGRGGAGGAGGPGQQGGAGGNSGFDLIPGTGPRENSQPNIFANEAAVSAMGLSAVHFMNCEGPRGKDGKDGASGARGASGRDGEKGRSCRSEEGHLSCRD